MADFKYQDMFPLTEDTTEYRLLTEDHVSTAVFDGAEVLKVSAQGLTVLAEQAFKDISHLLRP
ncbi:MAG: fumarate hydratase, partial [Deltaproteobacteria bacterium]|nr:fumarate hydratase [Deltaproteobacteria bacterium]